MRKILPHYLPSYLLSALLLAKSLGLSARTCPPTCDPRRQIEAGETVESMVTRDIAKRSPTRT